VERGEKKGSGRSCLRKVAPVIWRHGPLYRKRRKKGGKKNVPLAVVGAAVLNVVSYKKEKRGEGGGEGGRGGGGP